MIKFRPLRADEVELRVSRCSEKGAFFLLYKDTRCDMRILDETVGAENWQREHYECKGNLFCRVGIKTDSEWCFKADCGTESNTEKEKGESSDSFKRACFCWGIGRELYTKINIFIPMETVKNKYDNYEPKNKYAKYYVSEMEVSGEKITYLSVADKKGTVAFTYGQPAASLAGMDEKIDAVKIAVIEKELERTGTDKGKALAYYGVFSVEELNQMQACHLIKALEKREGKA